MLSLRCMMQWLILLWFAETQKFIIRHSGGWTADGQWPWLWHSAHCSTTPAIPQLWCQSPVILFTLYSNLFCFLTLHLAVNTNNLIKTYWIHKIDYVYLNDFLLLNVVEFKYMFSFWNIKRVWDSEPLFRDKNNMHSTGSERHQKICLNWRKPNGRNLQNQRWWTRRRQRRGETR